MSAFQFRLWRKMIQLVRDFYEGRVLFHPMVEGLVKDMEQAKLEDRELVRKWYDCFNPLEEADSEAWYEMKDLDYEKIIPLLQRMKEFLLEEEQMIRDSFAYSHPRRKIAHAKH